MEQLKKKTEAEAWCVKAQISHVWLICTSLSTDSLAVGLPMSITLKSPPKFSQTLHFVQWMYR